MPYYHNANRFKPSVTTLNMWLKTRKSKLGVKPGLFETVDDTTDQIWTLLALLIEICAFALTVYGAWDRYCKGTKDPSVLILACILVFLFILFDYIGILLHSHDEPNKVILRSMIRITTDSTKLRTLYQQAEDISWRRITSYLLLFLSALLKIIALLQFVSGNLMVVIILTLFYLVVIYIHSQHTGYYLAHLSFIKSVAQEYKEWLSSDSKGTTSQFNVSQPDQIVFSTNAPILTGDAKVFQNGRQKICFNQKTVNEDGSVSFEYTLTTEGCLWDEDITTLISFFSSHVTMSIIENSIRLQLSQIGIIPAISTNH